MSVKEEGGWKVFIIGARGEKCVLERRGGEVKSVYKGGKGWKVCIREWGAGWKVCIAQSGGRVKKCIKVGLCVKSVF